MLSKVVRGVLDWIRRRLRPTGAELPIQTHSEAGLDADSAGGDCVKNRKDRREPALGPDISESQGATAGDRADDPLDRKPNGNSKENGSPKAQEPTVPEAAPLPNTPDEPRSDSRVDNISDDCSPSEPPLPDTPSELPPDSNEPGGIPDSIEPQAPHEIGRRRLGPDRKPSPIKGKATGNPTMTPRPDLICRSPKGSWQWEMALTWDNDCDLREVRQNGKPLEIDDRECRIASFRGNLSIEYSDRESEQVALFEGKPLVFRLRKDWAGEGRRVRDVTKGHFMVIAPNDWQRAGEIPVEEAGCVDEEFVAHYFFRGGSETPGQSDRLGEHEIGIANSGYELDGTYVFDDSDHGPLFVGNVPDLHASEDIIWARVGEEAPNGWRGENFKPAERSLEDVLNGRQGRFFVRVYDSRSRLVDSGEFRYLRDLKEIRVDGEPYGENTVLRPPYSRMTVEFVGTNGLITPVLEDDAHAEIEAGGEIVVAGQRDGDVVRCWLKAEGGSIVCTIKLPRIWWRMERGDGELVKWRDTAIDLTRQEFREHARGGAAIMLHLPTRQKSIGVGFDDQIDRLYRPNAGAEAIEIPLLHFDDYSQIDRRLNTGALFNIECGEAVLTLIRVAADPAPEILSFTPEPAVVTTGETTVLRWETRNVEPRGVLIDPGIGRVEPCGSREISLLDTTIYTLKLMDPTFNDVRKSATVFVDLPLESGEIITPTQLLAKIMRVQPGTFVEYFRGHLVVDQDFFPEVRMLREATQILKEFQLVTLVQGKVKTGKFIYYAVRISNNFDQEIIKLLKDLEK